MHKFSTNLAFIRLKHRRYNTSLLREACSSLGDYSGAKSTRELIAFAFGDDSSVADAVLAELLATNDADGLKQLMSDGRKASNGRKPEEAFRPFWHVLGEVVDAAATAAEQRRQAGPDPEQGYLGPEWLSVRHMRDLVIRKLKEKHTDFQDGWVPSLECVRRQFHPSNHSKLTGPLFKKRFNVVLKVQKRTLHFDHPDHHYGNAQMKYAKAWSVLHSPHCCYLSVDDKAKVTVGGPGRHQQAIARQNAPSLHVTGEDIVVEDHDFTQTSVVPSVMLHVDVPATVDGKWHQGQAFVGFKDSVFQPSSAYRHLEETLRVTASINKPLMVLYSDGGPDRSLTRATVMLAHIYLFIKNDYDHLVVARTVPNFSLYNQCERVMSGINFALRNTSFNMVEAKVDGQPVELFKHCPSVSQLRLKEKEWSGPGDFRELYTQSLKPAIEKMEERVKHAQWADRHFQTYPAAEDAAIKAVTDGIKGILDLFKDVDTNRLDSIKRSLDKQDSVDVKDLENLGGDFAVFFESHVVRTTYTLQIRKVQDCKCRLCGEGQIKQPRMEGFFQTVNCLPAPVPLPDTGHGVHYKGFDELYGMAVQPQHVPSNKQRGGSVGGSNSCAKCYMNCWQCKKPRVLYAKKAGPLGSGNRESRELSQLLMTINMLDKYSCGMRCEDLLSLSRAKFKTLQDDPSLPFKDGDKLRAALQHLSNLLDFQEGLECHIYVEKAHYEPNNGFATKFKSGRKVDMCPGCLGSPGEQSAVDRQKTWSVRICDACKRDSPGGLLVYQGQAPRKRGAAADPTDDD